MIIFSLRQTHMRWDQNTNILTPPHGVVPPFCKPPKGEMPNGDPAIDFYTRARGDEMIKDIYSVLFFAMPSYMLLIETM